MAKFNELNYELLEHPAYSPDLTPCDYYLFLNLKKFLSGKLFTSNNEATAVVDGYFVNILKLYFNDDIELFGHCLDTSIYAFEVSGDDIKN